MEATPFLKEISIITSQPNDVDVVSQDLNGLSRLSFSDLPIIEEEEYHNHSSRIKSLSTEVGDDSFEFFTTASKHAKKLHNNNDNKDDDVNDRDQQLNEYQKRDYFSNKPYKTSYNHNNYYNDKHGGSFRSLSLTTLRSVSDVGRDHHQSTRVVNFSSLTSMSSKSRRRMFMFGPVKFKPEMEITAIKSRLIKAEQDHPSRREDGTGGGGRKWSAASWQMTRVLGCMPMMTSTGGFETYRTPHTF